MPLGAHLPTSKGFAAALIEAQKLGLDCLQIFSKSPRQWNAAPLDLQKAADFHKKWKQSGLFPLVAHDSFLINLASPDDALREKSIAAMVDEIERADALGCDFLVTHCGAHLKSSVEDGLSNLAVSLVECLEKTSGLNVKIALEITAGQGTCLGAPFSHIGEVLKSVDSPRLSSCFDTCHAFAAGHDIVNNLKDVLADFDAQIGLKNLGVMHLNDAKGVLGGHLDRHEHIGEGAIGPDAMRAIINHPKLKGLPFILETPEVETMIAKNVATVRELQETK
ncbi:Endonuclease IV [Abditibacterium utsteinense]|uniref:Probable endonuclease 4 n=1 Tax=Abditibacterium utsteinense TaxID=1960156 RepID=A0A2S8SRE7_9BACT|nr:deoxyribonuclease IV [Abditibacterium utsteinense]PQV63370.1 Endonuclease IV [Abditibacterium utsteinense]